MRTRNEKWLNRIPLVFALTLTLLLVGIIVKGISAGERSPNRSALVQRDVIAIHIMAEMAGPQGPGLPKALDSRYAKRSYELADALIKEGRRK